jgi:hypothetical protein
MESEKNQTSKTFKPTKTPTLKDDSSDEDIEAPKRVSVSIMNRRKVSPEEEDRMNRFMGQVGGKRKMQPSEGRLKGNTVVVDDIANKFDSNDLFHIGRARPPASSTPLDQEAMDVINYIQDEQQLKTDFYSDPLVQFMIYLDGFIDRDTVGKKVEKSNMKVSDLYQILADKKQGPPPLHTMSMQGHQSGFRGVGANISPLRVTRSLANSPDEDSVFGRVQSIRRSDAIQKVHGGMKRNRDTPEDSPEPPNKSTFGTPISPSQVKKGELRVPSNLPSSIQDEEEVAAKDKEERERLEELEEHIDDQAKTLKPKAPATKSDLLLFSQDPRYRMNVEKYLSNTRMAETYNWMNRPEVTGELPVSNNCISCMQLAYETLVHKYPDNYSGCTLIDLATKSLSNKFAMYVAMWVKKERGNSLNLTTLDKHEARMLENMHGYEKVLDEYYWDSGAQDFVHSPPQSARQQFGRNYKARRLATENEMFFY